MGGLLFTFVPGNRRVLVRNEGVLSVSPVAQQTAEHRLLGAPEML